MASQTDGVPFTKRYAHLSRNYDLSRYGRTCVCARGRIQIICL